MVDFRADPTRIVTRVTHFGRQTNFFSILIIIGDYCSLDNVFLYRIGAVLRILGGRKFIDEKSLRGFLLTCQSEVLSLPFLVSSVS